MKLLKKCKIIRGRGGQNSCTMCNCNLLFGLAHGGFRGGYDSIRKHVAR